MIILEGPDNSGKSTLANALADMFGYKVVHPGGAPKNLTDEVNMMINQRLLAEQNIIHDRVTCLSQPVYNTLRGEFNTNRKYMPYIRQFENDANVVIIYCRPPNELVLKMDGHEHKPHETAEHFQLVQQNQRLFVAAYDALMANVNHIHYDYTQDNAKSICNIPVLASLIGRKK